MGFPVRQIFAALIANLLVLGPLLGWGVALLFWPLDRLMRAPDIIGTSGLLALSIWWLVCCVVGNVFVGVPTFYRMQKRGDTHFGACLYELMKWGLAYSFTITAVLCYLLLSGSVALSPLLVMIGVFAALLVLPLTLGGVIYWYLAVRAKGGKCAVPVLWVGLFLFWNFLIYIFIFFVDAVG